MYERREILEVQDWGDKWQVVYIVEHVPEKGDADQQPWAEQMGHCFPKDTLEWRAAEYGIDPADTAKLLEVVLAEPFLQPADHAAGESLHDAPTIAVAQEAHLKRCARAKLRGRVSTRTARARAAGGPLETIYAGSPMDPEVLRLKREAVGHMREEFFQSMHGPQDRARGLREDLERRRSLNGRHAN